MNLAVSTTASDSNALILLVSLAFFIDLWVGFGDVRISLFLHLRSTYEP